ncbi:MAG: hypothetical protein J5621_09405, partial [Paludibacteraceae bacterium]|nr:hypothetical protein [Paludibacteraceae bacterium]
RNLSRRGWRDASEVAEKLDSITSEMMLVGNEKYQFAYTCGIDCVDANGNPTIGTTNAFAKLHISYGQLQHTQEPYIGWHGGLWEIGEADIDTDLNGVPLDANKAYYVYAICSENNTTASIVLSEDSSAADTDMLLGILSSVFEDQRVFSPTNGYTSIMGGQITTEQIQDAGRNLIIDFSSNPPRIIARGGAQIIGNISFLSANGTTQDVKTYIDTIDQNLQTQIDGNITSYFQNGVPYPNLDTSLPPHADTPPADAWVQAGEAEEDRHLGDLYYDNYTGYCYRWMKNESNVYGWLKIVDNDVVEALRNVDDVTNDCIISKGTEKINLKKEWLEVAGQNLNGTTDGTYYKATTEADNYRLTYGALTSAFNTLKGYMDALLTNVDANSYLSDYSGTLPEGAQRLSFSHADLNNAWKNYYTEEAALNNRIAIVGSGSRNYFAKKFMEDWNSARPTNLFTKATFANVPAGGEVYQDKCLMFSTRTENTSGNSNYFAVRKMIDSTHVYPTQGEARFVYMNTIGQFSGQFAKDSNWHYLQVYFNGNNANTSILIDADALFEDGKTYYITGRVSILDRSGSGNHAQVEELYIYEGTTAYYLNEYIGDKGYDNTYGEYFAVKLSQLYQVIGGAGSYNDILQGNVSFEAGKQYTLKVKWCSTSVVNYDTLYLGFKYSDGTRSSWMQCPKDRTTPVVNTLVSDEGKNVVGIACTFGTGSALTRIYDISLTEGAHAPLGGWIEAEEDKVQGGETLANYATADVNNMTKVGESGFRQVLADTKSELALTIDDYETGRIPSNNINTYVSNASVKLGRQAFSFMIRRATKVLRIKHNGSQHDAISTFTLDEPLAKGTRVVVSLEFVNISQGSFEWKDVMIQVGNKATDYQRYYQYLAQAFENDARAGQTNIEGGLIATSLIKLLNKDGDPKAGVSGLNDNTATCHGVSLFGGCNYADALAAATDGSTTRVPILLTKDGIRSMIGVFTVLEDKIIVKTNEGTIVIDDDEGISILDSGGLERVIVTPKTIANKTPATFSLPNFSKSVSVSYGSDAVSSSYTHQAEFTPNRTDKMRCTMNIPVNMAGGSVYSGGVYIPVGGSTLSNLKFKVIDKATGNVIYTKTIVSSKITPPNNSSTQQDTYNHTYAIDEEFNVTKDRTYRIEISFDYEVWNGNSSGYSSNPAYLSVGEGDSTNTKIKVQYTSMCAYLCSDGLAVMSNSDTKFAIEAGSSGTLKMTALGLPQQTSTQGLSYGQIYNSNGTLKIKLPK